MKLRGHIERGGTPCLILRKKNRSIHATIDTGFDGELCLDAGTLKKWNFVFKGTQEVELADGSLIESKIFSGTIRWFGEIRRVLAHETASKECLLGTGLLLQVELRIKIADEIVQLSGK